MPPRSFWVIGVMSGTSLDGLDIAYCEFWKKNNWEYRIHIATTISYSDEWREKLNQAHNLSGQELIKLHKDYGCFIGEQVATFVSANQIKQIDIIASHGHTIFHQPESQLNFQLGNGAFIASKTGITTVYDFRTLDIALGGQGAPLVPLGDELLFSSYNYCLNIGGISNISFKLNNKRVAFDICPSNIVLNFYAQQKGVPYDKDGSTARKGKIYMPLLNLLNQLEYYTLPYPKSLGREWVEQKFIPLVDSFSLSVEDKLATCTEHIAIQIGMQTQKKGKMLVTGGGAHNIFLIERIKLHTKSEVFIPDNLTVDYKEALIFAFLGLLRWKEKINVYSSVTGACMNSSSGVCVNVKANKRKGY